MQYGHFDDENKEYVITRPDTPKSWSNYLGDTTYGAIITNNGGGYSFFQSAAQGRFMRLMFNAIPMDQPGRYLYLHDKESKDFWSTTWQPVGKPLDRFKSICRHGTAYTIISSKYDQIETETRYFVPLGCHFECWHLRITNHDTRKRCFSLFSFIEYTNNWHLVQDLMNLQYTQSILSMDIVDNIIDHGFNVFLPDPGDEYNIHDQNRHTFLGIAGAKVIGFDTDRDVFIGPYRSYRNPLVVEQGKCTQSPAKGDNGCGTLQVDLDLDPGETRELVVIMGIGRANNQGKKALTRFQDLKQVQLAFEEVKSYWHSRLEGLIVETPDPEFNNMINMWTPFNCLITYAWSRAASLVYSGERDGLGYRDTVQDLIGVLHNIPEEARERLELMITGQVSSGGAMGVVKPFDHNPGKEKPPKEENYRSDDCLWLFNTIPAYVKETGDLDFFNKVLPFADQGEATILGHMRRAIQFNLERSGAHGLPCGLYADWNDCLELGQKGETIFVAFQLRYGLKTYIEICEMLQKSDEVQWAQEKLETLDTNLEKHAWDGEWYLRAFRYDGLKYGSKENDEGNLWLNPQSWAVISGHATPEKASQIMKVVKERLATDHGIMICDPPYEKTDHRVIKATLFNKGMKENGAIFCHTQGWAIMAETMLGHGDRAYQYYKSFLPASYNDKAEIRQIEPYVYCQYIHSRYSPRYGAARLPWLSGTASWAYYSATHYILGIQPDYHGLRIDPCIPAYWKTIKIQRRFRNKLFNITIENSSKVQKGVTELRLNDEILETNFIPLEKMKTKNRINAIMG